MLLAWILPISRKHASAIVGNCAAMFSHFCTSLSGTFSVPSSLRAGMDVD